MADKLTKEQRLKISVVRLKKSNSKLRQEMRMLKSELKLWKVKFKELEEKLNDKELERKNLLEKVYKRNKKAKAKPLGKKPGAKGYFRANPRESEVTERIEFTPIKCPYCHNPHLGKAQKTTIKYQEDIILIPEKTVKKIIITKHWCKNCREYVRSNRIPGNIYNLERIGPNVLAYVLYARYRLRLPFNRIRQSLKDLHNFEISEGEISSQLEKAKETFKADFEAIKELIRISDKVYCDETGWRVKGKNFWIWVFVTSKGIRYSIEDTRGKGVAEQALGDNENRVLISDFYSAYKNIPGRNQYCWVHLLRDSKQTESKLHKDLKQIYQKLKKELVKPVKQRNYQKFNKTLSKITKTKYQSKYKKKVDQLQKRITKTKEQLLTCLKHKDVLPENNTAERTLRNNVVMRKIFGCSRSVNSAKVMEINTSVIDTLLQQNPDKNFFELILPKIKKKTGL